MSDIVQKISALRRSVSLRFRHFRTRFLEPLRRVGYVGEIINFIAAAACIISIVIYQGFHHAPSGELALLRIIHGCQLIFATNIIYNLLLLFTDTKKSNQPIKWTMDMLVLITMLPLIYPRPLSPWIPLLDKILYSQYFLIGVLTVYSLLEISYGLIKVVGRRTNPSLLLSASFLFFIIMGSLLLMLPRCTVTEGMNYIDALFVSTSAVCITGLTTVDVAQMFTPFGILILSVLLQIGALGVMTFTSFFALFFQRQYIHIFATDGQGYDL